MEYAPDNLRISLVYDPAINYAFQQNAIPVVKELRFCNDSTPRKNLIIRITTEPAFAEPVGQLDDDVSCLLAARANERGES